MNNSQKNYNKAQAKIYVDMDGTLNMWRPNATVQETHQVGFFRRARPHEGICALVGTMIDMGLPVYIASSTYEDSHSELEKRQWLHKYLPDVPEDRQIFVPYGVKKEDYLIHTPSDVLISDRTENELDSWSGKGIKVLNGHNGKHGRWKGAKISVQSDLYELLDVVLKVASA